MNLFLDIKHPDNLIDALKELGYTIQSEPNQDTEVMVTTNKKYLNNPDRYPSLKLVQLTSAGFDYFDVDKLKNQGITVLNARGVYSLAIAEFVVTRLLEVNQQLRTLNKLQSESKWERKINLRSLKGMKGAILGTGSISNEIARLLKPFGPIIDGYNTKGTAHDDYHQCFPLIEFDDYARTYDFVIITLPLNEHTKGYFNEDRLHRLSPDCILINIARGPIIIESELIKVLDYHLQAVVLDVFEQEPLVSESLLWQHPKAYLSSHVSYMNNFYKDNVSNLIQDNLIRYIKQEDLINIV